MAEKQKVSIAVIGMGACGLTTLKNLLEAGFNATGFDRNEFVGGLWQWTDATDRTSVLKSTYANLSKQLGCYTDFPFGDLAKEDFPSAAETAKYLNAYADHFSLRERMKLGIDVRRIVREGEKWILETGSERLRFDKVAVCAGLQVQKPIVPKIPGLETFTGNYMHSNGYVQASDFDGKRVLVVGLGNTGPDIAVDLIGHATEVWLSHRRSNAMFTRRDPDGKPNDHVLSLRITKLGGLFSKYFPALAEQGAKLGFKRVQKRAFGNIRPEWGAIGTPQTPSRKTTTLNDELIPALLERKLSVKPALTGIEKDKATFSDNSTLSNLDAIIFATGFRSDFSFMDTSADPTRNTRKDWSSLPGANGRPLPRLYQGIFSLDFPDSLVFLGTSPLTPQAFLNYDISSLAVAQIWTGNSVLPPTEVMNAHVDAQHEVVCGLARTGEVANTNIRNNWEWFKWCDEAAGLGIVKRVGYGIEGWKFWWRERKLCRLVMDGLMSPHLFRLFDEGKRKPWVEARKALEEVNAKR